MTARLREMSDVPIILITGKSDEADKLRGFRLGVDDYVTKPFSFAELTARVQAVLARNRVKDNQERHLLIIGELVIDVDKRLARRGDEPIPLTPTDTACWNSWLTTRVTPSLRLSWCSRFGAVSAERTPPPCAAISGSCARNWRMTPPIRG